MSAWFIVAVVVWVVTLVAWVLYLKHPSRPEPPDGDGTGSNWKAHEKYQERLAYWNAGRRGKKYTAVAGTGLSVALLLFTTLYFQSVGTAKIQVAFGQPVAVTVEPGVHTKAPWAKTVTWDLFSRDVLFAGAPDKAPVYANGEIDGATITSSVARGTQVDFDLQATYQINTENAEATVMELYRNYRNQERFTRQVINPQILSVARQVPSGYQPIEFRGEKRAEAEQKIQDGIESKLAQFNISFVVKPTVQNIAYPDNVEKSISAVEEAQQKEAQAQAELRAVEVSSQKKVAEAQAEADANKLLAQSLSPEVLESKRLDTLKAIGDSGNMVVVPEGSTPFVQVPSGTKTE